MAVISTSMASPSNNTMSQRHPTPTNILAQHLQRGLTPKTNIQGLPSNTTTGHQQMGSYNQNTGILKGPNNNTNNMMMASPSSSSVSTTTLSLISTTGFSNPSSTVGSGNLGGVYSMTNTQQQQLSRNLQNNVVIGPPQNIISHQLTSSPSTSAINAAGQNQQQRSFTSSAITIPLQQRQMGYIGGSVNNGNLVADPSQAGRRASFSGSGGSVIIGGSNAAEATMGPTANPSPQLQGLLMQQQSNTTLIQVRFNLARATANLKMILLKDL